LKLKSFKIGTDITLRMSRLNECLDRGRAMMMMTLRINLKYGHQNILIWFVLGDSVCNGWLHYWWLWITI